VERSKIDFALDAFALTLPGDPSRNHGSPFNAELASWWFIGARLSGMRVPSFAIVKITCWFPGDEINVRFAWHQSTCAKRAVLSRFPVALLRRQCVKSEYRLSLDFDFASTRSSIYPAETSRRKTIHCDPLRGGKSGQRNARVNPTEIIWYLNIELAGVVEFDARARHLQCKSHRGPRLGS
jgi:hypothetical protein